jgi:hypothetical protein
MVDSELDTLVRTAPDLEGSPSLPKRNGPKTLLPSTWVVRTLRLEYTDSYGVGQEASGVLLDLFPFGPVFDLSGEKTALSWECLRTVTLLND